MSYNSKGELHMGYVVLPPRDQKWQPRKGLEGPFFYANGRVLYYDPKEGQYWDPNTDFYIEIGEVHEMEQQFFDLFTQQKIG